jgi:DNA-binding NarL/FixJ family response regulator
MARSNFASPTTSRSLSQQELIVFEQLALGKSDEEIAAQLEMSSRSVGLYRERIRHKLGLSSPPDSVKHPSTWIQEGKNIPSSLSHPGLLPTSVGAPHPPSP